MRVEPRSSKIFVCALLMVKPTVVRRKPARDSSLLAKMLGRVCRVFIFYRKWQGIGASSSRPLSYLLRSRRLNQWCRSLSYRVTVQVKKTYAFSILLKRPASLRERVPFVLLALLPPAPALSSPTACCSGLTIHQRGRNRRTIVY